MMSKTLSVLFLFIIVIPIIVGVNETDSIYVVNQVDDGLENFITQDYEPFAYQYSAENDQDSDGYTIAIDCDDTNPDVHPGQDEQCNNVDDNCDGNIDEGLLRDYGSDMGECVQGEQRCILGAWIIIDSELGPTLEICDNLDNDCDGAVDEDLTQPSSNQNGACNGNMLECSAGAWIEFEENYVPHDELCDNIDNDCDSLVDENLNERTQNQMGLCFGNTETCQEGDWIPDYGNYLPANETCDRSDNDCDGFIDEDFDYDQDGFFTNEFCTNAFYVELDCDDSNNGVNPSEYEICGDGIDQDCDGSDVACNFDGDGDGYTYIIDCNDDNPFIHPNTDEQCDNLDNNCDGNIDEGLFRDAINQNGMCIDNVEQCVLGEWLNTNGNYLPQNETCDGQDNDCDGLVDEDLNRPTENQLGECSGDYQTCQDGGWIDYFGNHQMTAELLDGKDNDCDGAIDEGTDILFDITTNKEVYSIQDIATVTLVAPDNSSVNITVTYVDGHQQKMSYQGDFPYTFMTDVFDSKGTYQIISDFNYLYVNQLVQKNIEVINSMTGEIQVRDYDELSNDRDVGFIGVASGGTAPYFYEWDFGDGVTGTGETVSHRYSDIKDYTITLRVKDSADNEITLTRKIRVQGRYDITFSFKDEETSKPIPNLKVRFDEETKETDSVGDVMFTRISGTYDIKTVDSDYPFEKKNIKVSANTAQTYTLSREDNNRPIIDLITPQDRQVIQSDEFSFTFRIIDESKVDCNFYMNEDSKYWEYLGSVTEIENTNRQEYAVTGLANAQNIFKIECIDKAGNYIEKDINVILDLSANTMNADKEDENSEDVPVTEEMYDIISELEKKARDLSIELDGTVKKIKSFDDKIKLLLNRVGFADIIETNKKAYNELARELFGLKNGDVNPKDQYELITSKVTNMMSQTPNSIEVGETFELQGVTIKDIDVETLTNEYLKDSGASEKEIKSIIKSNKELNTDLTYNVRATTFTIGFQGNSAQDFTIIEKTIVGEYSIDNLGIIEEIPKGSLSDASQLLTTETFTVIKKDPIILFKINQDSIVYAVPKKISKHDLEGIQTILSVEDYNSMLSAQSDNKITGWITGIDFGGSDNTKFFLETSLIVILLIVYVVMQFDVKQYLGADKEVAQLKKMIKSARINLEQKEHEIVKKVYKDIMYKYATLSSKAKHKIYPLTDNLYNEMIVANIHNMIDNIKSHINTDNHSMAKASYRKIKELYSQLPSSYKKEVSDRTMETFRELAKI